MRYLAREPPLPGVVLDPLPAGLLLPEECACCGAQASHQRALPRPGRAPLLIGYCDECARHLAGAGTRQLASALSSLLLALSGAAALPLLLPGLGLFALLLLVALLASLPIAFLLLPRWAPESPHAARSLAVRAFGQRGLVCLSPAFGAKAAELNGLRAARIELREPRLSAWQSAGPLLGLGAAILFHTLHHPELRVVNDSDTQLDVLLDGQRLVSVEPTSQESPAAGVVVHVPTGRHALSTRNPEGALSTPTEVEFESGHVHLFAPGSDGSCFWLETLGYGDERRSEPVYQPLGGSDRFWVLPDGIDLWFSPAVEAESTRLRSSGGFITALRQAPCSRAPPRAQQ